MRQKMPALSHTSTTEIISVPTGSLIMCYLCHIYNVSCVISLILYDAPVISLSSTALEVVPAFVSLGSSISGDSTASSDDVECRIGKAAGAFAQLKVCVWKWRNISLTTKMKSFNAVVITTLLYTSNAGRSWRPA